MFGIDVKRVRRLSEKGLLLEWLLNTVLDMGK